MQYHLYTKGYYLSDIGVGICAYIVTDEDNKVLAREAITYNMPYSSQHEMELMAVTAAENFLFEYDNKYNVYQDVVEACIHSDSTCAMNILSGQWKAKQIDASKILESHEFYTKGFLVSFKYTNKDKSKFYKSVIDMVKQACKKAENKAKYEDLY